MKHIIRFWITMVFLLGVALLVACGPNPEQIAAMTLAAASPTPTNTPIPPTATATATFTPTDTPEPTPTTTNTPKPTNTPVPPTTTPTGTEMAPLAAEIDTFKYNGKLIQIESVFTDPKCTQSQEKGTNCLWIALRLPKGTSQIEAIQVMLALQGSHITDQNGYRTVRQPDVMMEIGQEDTQGLKLLFFVKTMATSFTLELPDNQQIPIAPNG